MILYHGTNVQFDVIDFMRCNPYKDFGRGFYLTDLRNQAQAMAIKRMKISGGMPIVQEYEFEENLLDSGDLKVLRFMTPTKAWAEFVFKNRSRELNFRHDYDIVTGPIADDGVAYLLSRYEEGIISLEELAKELQYKELNKQFYFGTPKALSFLKRLC